MLQRLYEALTLTFLAEWGDRSQISTIALAAAKDMDRKRLWDKHHDLNIGYENSLLCITALLRMFIYE